MKPTKTCLSSPPQWNSWKSLHPPWRHADQHISCLQHQSPFHERLATEQLLILWQTSCPPSSGLTHLTMAALTAQTDPWKRREGGGGQWWRSSTTHHMNWHKKLHNVPYCMNMSEWQEKQQERQLRWASGPEATETRPHLGLFLHIRPYSNTW